MDRINTRDVLVNSGLSLDRSYYLLSGGVGDAWLTLSVLPEAIQKNSNTTVFLSEDYLPIAVKFFSQQEISNNFAIINKASYLQIKAIAEKDDEALAEISPGRFPRGIIRPTLTVSYPFFNFLANFVPYSRLIRLILCLPAHGEATYRMPIRNPLSNEDLARTYGLRKSTAKKVLINPLTFSYKQLPIELVISIIDRLTSYNVDTYFNLSLPANQHIHDDAYQYSLRLNAIGKEKGVQILEVRIDEMAAVFDQFDLYIGICSGGANVALAFCNCDVLILKTDGNWDMPARGFTPKHFNFIAMCENFVNHQRRNRRLAEFGQDEYSTSELESIFAFIDSCLRQ